MSDLIGSNQTRKRSCARTILLLLALITSPLFCCGCIFFLEVLPASLLPPALDFMMNLFESEARVENRSGETLYITPIATAYGQPAVITQLNSFSLRDVPLKPNRSVTLTYDSADMPLSGIVVCRANEDCRLLAVDHSDVYYVDSFESLPGVEPSWLLAVQSTPKYNFTVLLILVSGFLPVVLFLSWLYLGRLEGRPGRYARAGD